MPELRLSSDKCGKWFWIIKDSKKEIVARGRSYHTKKVALKEAMNLIKMKNDPEVIHYVVDNLEVMI